MGKIHEMMFDLEPLNLKKPQWAAKMGKKPGVKFEFGRLPKRKNAPRVIFDFEPLNPKRPQWAPKMGKSPGVKFEFGAQRWAEAPRSN
jgi:hypothetical protein